MAWYGNNSGNNPLDAAAIWANDKANYGKRITENGNQTHPVGQKQANSFGLYDMHGNVWEWCQDYYQENYQGAPSDGSTWLSGKDSRFRVMRGGSWTKPLPTAAALPTAAGTGRALATTTSVFAWWRPRGLRSLFSLDFARECARSNYMSGFDA